MTTKAVTKLKGPFGVGIWERSPSLQNLQVNDYLIHIGWPGWSGAKSVPENTYLRLSKLVDRQVVDNTPNRQEVRRIFRDYPNKNSGVFQWPHIGAYLMEISSPSSRAAVAIKADRVRKFLVGSGRISDVMEFVILILHMWSDVVLGSHVFIFKDHPLLMFLEVPLKFHEKAFKWYYTVLKDEYLQYVDKRRLWDSMVEIWYLGNIFMQVVGFVRGLSPSNLDVICMAAKMLRTKYSSQAIFYHLVQAHKSKTKLFGKVLTHSSFDSSYQHSLWYYFELCVNSKGGSSIDIKNLNTWRSKIAIDKYDSGDCWNGQCKDTDDKKGDEKSSIEVVPAYPQMMSPPRKQDCNFSFHDQLDGLKSSSEPRKLGNRKFFNTTRVARSIDAAMSKKIDFMIGKIGKASSCKKLKFVLSKHHVDKDEFGGFEGCGWDEILWWIATGNLKIVLAFMIIIYGNLYPLNNEQPVVNVVTGIDNDQFGILVIWLENTGIFKQPKELLQMRMVYRLLRAWTMELIQIPDGITFDWMYAAMPIYRNVGWLSIRQEMEYVLFKMYHIINKDLANTSFFVKVI